MRLFFLNPLMFVMATCLLSCSASKTDSSEVEPKQAQAIRYSYTDNPVPDNDEVVATVNGTPILASCVSDQAKAHALNSSEALDECIEFELLAQAALDAGFVKDAMVQESAKRESIRLFVDNEFHLETPDDLAKEDVMEHWERAKNSINRPELRVSHVCRAGVSPNASTETVENANALISRARQNIGNRSTLARFKDLCFEFTKDPEVNQRNGLLHSKIQLIASIQDDGSRLKLEEAGQAIDRTYSDAVFSISKKNELSQPVRTQRGWEFYYLREIHPEIQLSFVEAEKELRERLFEDPNFKQRVFAKWVYSMQKRDSIRAFPERIQEKVSSLSVSPP